MCAPEGPERALLRYVERRRPSRRAVELADAGPRPAAFIVTESPPAKHLVTAEGEHAAIVTRAGTLENRAFVLVYGYVYLDDYFSSLEGICVPELVATVEEMLQSDVHMLGRVRRRRFNYKPPVGWSQESDVFETRWFLPGEPAQMFVNPAIPLSPGLVRGVLDHFKASHVQPEHFTTKANLAGEHYAIGDLHLFFLSDQDFLYSVRADYDVHAGRALVESIEPVPRAQRASGHGLGHWVD